MDMEGSQFDERAFFEAIAKSGARALLIGRRALIVLGLPLVTGDYDYWLHVDDIELFNDAVTPFDLLPDRSAEEARRKGRYVLQNSERVDVLVARANPLVDGGRLAFDDAWARREHHGAIQMPSLDDLIATKRFGQRSKDAIDIQMLEQLKAKRQP